MIILSGYLEHITYHNPQNYYTVARLLVTETGNTITVIGYLPGVRPGESIKAQGEWQSHRKYGQQFKIDSFEVTLPSTIDGIRDYLQSGVIKGIGPKMAQRLVGHFEEDTLTVIEKEPHRLTEVKGFGQAKAHKIIRAWEKHHAVRDLMQFLQKNGLSPAYGATLLKQYGAKAAGILREDPYRAAQDLPAKGFYIADTIACNQGTSKEDPQRIKACILHLLDLAASDGHTYIPEKHLMRRCRKLFEIVAQDTEAAIQVLVTERELVREVATDDGRQTAIFTYKLHQYETKIAQRLTALLSIPSQLATLTPEEISQKSVTQLAMVPSKEQLSVLKDIFGHRLAIITGGPGTGKTTLIRFLTTIFESSGQKIVLAAPTGRAARRLSDVTGRQAATIHKLLEYSFNQNRFEKGPDNPLEGDVVIVDEASMVDTFLMYHLISALPLTTILVMVGDIFQLPSVGPGNVLADMILSNTIKSFKLKEIHRQAIASPIVINAHRVRRGEMPEICPLSAEEDLQEYYFIEQANPDRAVETIINLCSRRIPQRFGLDAKRDIQVITPMHKGSVGTINLNQVLQKALNPRAAGTSISGMPFCSGDKVMHLKNNYHKEVFNGDIGTIGSIDPIKTRLVVEYDDRNVNYDFEETGELTLAYAISVHKSQGSEYPAIIVPIMTQHYALLQRNLLYTAMTRGKHLVVIVGTRKALSIALENNKPRQRLSSLDFRLKTSRSFLGLAHK